MLSLGGLNFFAGISHMISLGDTSAVHHANPLINVSALSLPVRRDVSSTEVDTAAAQRVTAAGAYSWFRQNWSGRRVTRSNYH
jgi:hypothetical protein